MEEETRSIVWVLATIVLVVGAGYAGFASLENYLMAGRAAAAGMHPIVVHAEDKRAVVLLLVAILFYMAASTVFGQSIPQRPGRTSPRYAISTAICGVAIALMIIVLHVTATWLKMV